jgi:hypothetical protein
MGEEKRREERLKLEVPVMLLTGMGMSRDINSSAIYFVTEQFLPRGCPVTFRMRLDHACVDKPLYLDCRGRVLRVEESGEKFGIVASGIILAGYFSPP